ncbi:MAG: 1-phosphatidylinositol-3-phosphate 5-kinase [Geoglossum umbratile]|nr:MAG: 1-phosphatidylinositol-3-phosphate 5-kinase [Geoglossum umbratile]
MASKPLQNPPSPSASTLFLPLGRLSRRGSLASLSSPTQLDKESLSQALDQIHNSASQSESLTTFNEFASPPPSTSAPEAKRITGELVQSGLSGLYSRFRGVVGGVRDIVEDAIGSGADSNADTTATRPDEGASEASTTALSSPVVVSTPSESSLQSPVTTMFSSTATSSQAQLHKVSSNSSRTSIAPPKTPASFSIASAVKAPLPPFSRMTTSAAANPTLVPVTVNAFKDGDGHITDGSSAAARADIFAREPFSSSGQPNDKELSRTQVPRAIRASPLSSRKPSSTAPNPSAFTEEVGELPDLDTRQLSESENPEAARDEDSVNEDGLVVVRDANRYGEDNRHQGDTKSGSFDGSREVSNKPLTTSKDTSIKSQRFATSIPTPTTTIQTTIQPTTTRPKDASSDTTSSKATGPSQSPKQPTPDGALITPTAALKRQPAISRISESHLPGFKLTRSLSADTTESSVADTISSTNAHKETLNQADDEISHTESGIKRQQIGAKNEGHAEAVNTVLKQLRSGVLSKEFWMKDENCKECFLCGDSFSTWRRKHHCRICGQIFDSKCTSVVYRQQESIRVCKPCKEIIDRFQDDSDESDDNTVLPTTFFTQPHMLPNGTAPGNEPADTRQDMSTGIEKEQRPLSTPMMAIPATRRTGNSSSRRSAVLEINAGDISIPSSRPSSSRSVRTPLSGRPHSSGHKRHHSRHQFPRSFRASNEDRAPFHRNPAEDLGKRSRLPAFHNDSIIDPDLAPYMSDEGSSGDEQMSIFAAMNSDTLTVGTTDHERNAFVGLPTLGKKPRSNIGGKTNNGMSFNSKDIDDGSGSSAKASHLQRATRKRNLSNASNAQQRPSPKPAKNAGLLRGLGTSFADALSGSAGALQVLATPGISSSRVTRSASMRGSTAPAVELNHASLQHVHKLLRQLLEDSGVSNVNGWEQALMPILLRCTDDVNPDVRHGDDIDIRHYVKVKRIAGGRPGDTSHVSGVVFSKKLALKSMPRSIQNPRIVIIKFPIEYHRHQQHFMSLEPVIAQEKEFLQNMVNRIVALRPQLLLVQRNISGLALQYLAEANVATAYNVKPSVLEAVSRCAQADIVSSIDILTLKPIRVGKCAAFDLKTYVHKDIPGRKKTYVYFSGCPKELGCTIVLRGADMETLAKMKRITEFMVYVVYNLKLETCLMRDEFVLIPSTTNGGTISPTKDSTPVSATTPESAYDQDTVPASKTPKARDNMMSTDHKDEPLHATKVVSGAVDDDHLPEDVPMPTFYGDMVEKHKTKILSASPFVKFTQPYLLMRARGQERRLVYLKRLKDQDNIEEQTAEDKAKPQKFQLITPEMIHERVEGAPRKVREVLHAVHDAEYDKALHNYQTQTRQWEAYISGNIDLFNPFAHQNIAVLYTVVCTITSVPCLGPDSLALSFYNEHDMDGPDCTLGQYVEDLTLGAGTICTANGCERNMFEHHRSYVHGEARISVFVERYPCKIRGLQDSILMWSYCKICNKETQIIPMSESTWKYSFGKYLELSFWSSDLHLRAGVCPHDLHRNHVRYFGFKDVALRIHYDPIDLLEIVVPRTRITWKVENDLRLKNDHFTKTEERLNRFMYSVKSRIMGINVDSVIPEKAEACKIEIEKLTKRANDEHNWLIRKLQDKYMNSEYYEILPQNRAVRAMQEKVAEWDSIFAEFDNNFFPSEKDITRLVTLQLKKILDRDDSVSSTTSIDEGTNTPLTEVYDTERASPSDSVELTSTTTNMSPEKTHNMLTSVVEEHSEAVKEAGRPQGDSHDDDTTPVPRQTGEANSIISNLDLVLPSQFPEQTLQGRVPVQVESRAVSPTDTRDMKFWEPGATTAPASQASKPQAESENNIKSSQESVSTPTSKPTSQPSAIPRLSDAGQRGKARNVSPPLYRTQSQPIHLRRTEALGNTKSMASPTTADATRKTGEPPQIHQGASKGSERKVSERLGLTALKHAKKTAGHSLIPRSVGGKRKESKVSTLAKHFEQLSREFEKERLREKRHLAATTKRSRAYPKFSSKPIVQVYQNAHEAVEEKEPSDEDLNAGLPAESSNEATSMIDSSITESTAATTTSQSPIDAPHTGETLIENIENEDAAASTSQAPSDAEGDGSDADHSLLDDIQIPSTAEGSQPLSPTDSHLYLKLELPKHERTSLLKMLTNFWAERSASGWAALDYPLNATDHVFVDSDVIVREDEPSSLIAFALSSEDYNAKLQSIRQQDGGIPSIHEEVDHANFQPESEEQLELERSLLRSTGTHLKYQFQEGSAKMLCKIFYAEQFDAVRKKCGVADRIVESLSRCVKWDSKGGKSGSVFLKTSDGRFVLKALSPIETQAFLRFAPAYFQLMSEALFHELPSVIAKMLGFFQIIIKNPLTGVDLKWDVLVMENLFYDRTPSRIFDLKGSMRDRKIQSTGEQNEVLLDENMVEFIYESPLFAREHSKKLLRASVWNDTLFLARQDVMDYSLMIAMDETRKELIVGIIDCIRTYTWDKKLESWIKDRGFAGGGRNKPTVTSPKEYKSRFREAMARYVLQAPNCWHQFQAHVEHGATHLHRPVEFREEDKIEAEAEAAAGAKSMV